MQDLRDKLLKAGLVGKKEAREARARARREQREGQPSTDALAEQRERFAAQQAEKARQSRELQEAANRERERVEGAARLRRLIRAHAVNRFLGDERLFYFPGSDRRIRRLATTHEVAAQLVQGRLALVEVDDDPRRDYALVDVEAARRLEELDRSRLLFWNKPGAGEGDLPAYGAGQGDLPTTGSGS